MRRRSRRSKASAPRCVGGSLPHTEYAVAVYYILAPAEASSNLARYDGVQYGFRAERRAATCSSMYRRPGPQGFGPEVKRRIMLGTYALSAGYYDAYYRKAPQVRTLIKRDFDEAFEKCDVLLRPRRRRRPSGSAEKTDDPLQMYLSDIFTISTNLAGHPGDLASPAASRRAGFPSASSSSAGHFDGGDLLQVGPRLRADMPKSGTKRPGRNTANGMNTKRSSASRSTRSS